MSFRDPPSDILIVNRDKVLFSSGVGRLTSQPKISATLANVLTLFSQKIMRGDHIRFIRFDDDRMIFLASQKPQFPSLVAVVLVPTEVNPKQVILLMKIVLNLIEEFLLGKIDDPKILELDCFNRVLNFPSQSLFLLPKTAEGLRSALVLLAGYAHDFQVKIEKVTSRMFFVEPDYLAIEKLIDKFDNLGVLSFIPLPDHLKNPPNKFCEIGTESPIKQFFSARSGEKPFQTLGRIFGSDSNAFKMKSFIDNYEALEVVRSIAKLDKIYDVFVRNDILLATTVNPGRDVVTTLSKHLLLKMREISSKQNIPLAKTEHLDTLFPHITTDHKVSEQIDGFIRIKNVERVYKMGNQQIFALRNVSLNLASGQLVVILGPSGSGKTTLLNVIGGIDKCEGTIEVGDINVTKLSKGELSKYRRENCGFIFQFFNLIPVLNALENVEYAVELSRSRELLTPVQTYLSRRKMSHIEVRAKTEAYIKKVGLWEKRFSFPSQLSGGEQQRIAAARAFAKEPEILLCDEPTGELSVKEGKKVLAVIQEIITDRPNILVILVTHNQKISLIGNQVIRLRSGKIDSIVSQTPTPAEEITW
ncbi:MAG: ABC transporter ATP-binding protein [Candidatus Hodarchaeales archaeon]|jgi:putative ABC transport system ATP-binding protein